MTRESSIQNAIKLNIPINEINEGLQYRGYKPLSKEETIRIQEGTYGNNLLQDLGKGLSNLGGGLATIGGGIGQAIVDPNVRKKALNKASEYVSTHNIGDMGADVVNAILTPYNNLTGEKALTQPLSETVSDIVQGAKAHPFDAILDFGIPGGVGAAKALSKTKAGQKIITNNINTINKSNIPSSIKSFIPGTKEANVNAILNVGKYTPNENITRYNDLNIKLKTYSPSTVADAIKNLEEGTRIGDKTVLEATDTLKNLSKDIESEYIKYGLDKETSKINTIAQYMTREVSKDGKNIPVNTFQSWLNGEIKEIEGVTAKRLGNLYGKGIELYEAGDIVPIRHITDAKMGREGFIDETEKLNKPKEAKSYGTQSYEDLGKSLARSGYTSTINDIKKLEQTSGALDEINKVAGRKIDDLTNLKLEPNEVVVSPRLLKERLGRMTVQGENLDDAIKSLNRGLNEAEMAKYADDLYVLSKDDLTALERAYTRPTKNFMSDVANSKLVQAAKRSALSTPMYTIGNITTNWGLNTIQGVTLPYYLKAIDMMDKIPDALKATTTFSGYLGAEARLNTSLKDIYKGLGKRMATGSVPERLDAFSEAMTSPLFKTSGATETLDRSANFIYQAEKVAKETNKTIEEVLEAARKNGGQNETFRNLMDRVNNSLGDYVGRNMYVNPNINSLGSVFTPFIRPYTQGLRVFATNTIENPLRNNLYARVPARLGNEISEYAEENMNVTPSKHYGGGFPVLPAMGRMPSRVAINPYHAYSALGELVNEPTEALGGNLMMAAPMLGLQGNNRYNQPATLPNQITINGRRVQLDNNGNEVKPGLMDRLQLAVAQSAQAYFAPVNVMNSTVLPTLAFLAGKEYRRPVDNALFGTIGETNIPFISQSDEASRARVGIEILAPMMGYRFMDTYPERKQSMKDRAKAIRKRNQKIQRNERR